MYVENVGLMRSQTNYHSFSLNNLRDYTTLYSIILVDIQRGARVRARHIALKNMLSRVVSMPDVVVGLVWKLTPTLGMVQ